MRQGLRSDGTVRHCTVLVSARFSAPFPQGPLGAVFALLSTESSGLPGAQFSRAAHLPRPPLVAFAGGTDTSRQRTPKCGICTSADPEMLRSSALARFINCRPETIARVRSGEQTGRNIAGRLLIFAEAYNLCRLSRY